MPIRYFDMFAGIGGFRSALEAIGGFECVGYCEIDKVLVGKIGLIIYKANIPIV